MPARYHDGFVRDERVQQLEEHAAGDGMKIAKRPQIHDEFAALGYAQGSRLPLFQEGFQVRGLQIPGQNQSHAVCAPGDSQGGRSAGLCERTLLLFAGLGGAPELFQLFEQHFAFVWFQQEIKRAGLSGRHQLAAIRRLQCHDHRHFTGDLVRAQFRHDGRAARTGDIHGEQDEIRIPGAGQFHAAPGRADRKHPVTQTAQIATDLPQEILVAIDDDNQPHGHPGKGTSGPMVSKHNSGSGVRKRLVGCASLVVALGCAGLPKRAGEEPFDVRAGSSRSVRILAYNGDLSYRPRTPLHLSASEHRPVAGLDQLAAADFSLLRGRKFALLLNDTARLANQDHLLPVLLHRGLRPRLILEPEHGVFGALDKEGPDGIRTDSRTKLRFLSLYSPAHYRPERRHLVGVDLIVVDLENLPVRCYTYVTTLTYVLEAAAESGIEVLLLDRVNPYGPWRAQGSLPDPAFRSFVAEAPVPFLYSMTLGEYASFLVRTRLPQLHLTVVRVRDFRRDDVRSALSRVWVNPSPNIPGPEAAIVYPGLVLFEGTNLSLGRGTTRPFVYSGAPWMDAQAVLAQLRRLELPGVKFATVRFQPTSSVHAGVLCHGIQITPLSTEFDALRTGYEYLRIVRRLHPQRFELLRAENLHLIDRLWGGTGYREALLGDHNWDQFAGTWQKQADSFEAQTRRDRLY